MLSFFPRDVLDEILNLIESVSEGFPSYSHMCREYTKRHSTPVVVKLKCSLEDGPLKSKEQVIRVCSWL